MSEASFVFPHPSLCISHLPTSHTKGLPTPVIAVDAAQKDFGGYYWKPGPNRFLSDGREVRGDRGVIVVCAGSVASTVTHEYRHHMQAFMCADSMPSSWQQTGIYKLDIVEYFRNDWKEMDALLYEVKHTPDDVNLLWHEWVRTECP